MVAATSVPCVYCQICPPALLVSGDVIRFSLVLSYAMVLFLSLADYCAAKAEPSWLMMTTPLFCSSFEPMYAVARANE